MKSNQLQHLLKRDFVQSNEEQRQSLLIDLGNVDSQLLVSQQPFAERGDGLSLTTGIAGDARNADVCKGVWPRWINVVKAAIHAWENDVTAVRAVRRWKTVKRRPKEGRNLIFHNGANTTSAPCNCASRSRKTADEFGLVSSASDGLTVPTVQSVVAPQDFLVVVWMRLIPLALQAFAAHAARMMFLFFFAPAAYHKRH